MFLEKGVWGEAPHIALLLFAEKQKERFLEPPEKDKQQCLFRGQSFRFRQCTERRNVRTAFSASASQQKKESDENHPTQHNIERVLWRKAMIKILHDFHAGSSLVPQTAVSP